MCDDLEKRYRQYAATMQDVGITPHSFTAWKRVQKSAPPYALLLEAGFKSLEQRVIDASYRTYKKWLAWRACTPRKPVTFEQWLTAKNIITRVYPDAAARSVFYSQGKQWGFLNTNMILELEDMNPVENEKVGETFWQPINMQDAGDPQATRRENYFIGRVCFDAELVLLTLALMDLKDFLRVRREK